MQIGCQGVGQRCFGAQQLVVDTGFHAEALEAAQILLKGAEVALTYDFGCRDDLVGALAVDKAHGVVKGKLEFVTVEHLEEDEVVVRKTKAADALANALVSIKKIADKDNDATAIEALAEDVEDFARFANASRFWWICLSTVSSLACSSIVA